jgi:hypothetical protein
MEIGGRQGGKSEMEASYFGMNAIMFKNTQNVMCVLMTMIYPYLRTRISV